MAAALMLPHLNWSSTCVPVWDMEAVYGLRVVESHCPERAWATAGLSDSRRGSCEKQFPAECSVGAAHRRPLWLHQPQLLTEQAGLPCRNGVLRLLEGPGVHRDGLVGAWRRSSRLLRCGRHAWRAALGISRTTETTPLVSAGSVRMSGQNEQGAHAAGLRWSDRAFPVWGVALRMATLIVAHTDGTTTTCTGPWVLSPAGGPPHERPAVRRATLPDQLYVSARRLASA